VTQAEPYFVKANKVDLPTDINPLWADAENLLFLQPPLGINSSCCQGSGDSGRHSQGEEEEGHSHHVCHRLLQTVRATGVRGWEQHPSQLPPHSEGPILPPRSNAPQALPLGMTDLLCFVLPIHPINTPTTPHFWHLKTEIQKRTIFQGS